MVELVIADDDDPAPEQIRQRISVSDREDIESAFEDVEQIWYGTHYLLRGAQIKMTAICVSGPYLRREETGRFLLYRDGNLVNDSATRQEVIRSLGDAIG